MTEWGVVCSLPLHRHSYIGFILAFASSIHNKQPQECLPHQVQKDVFGFLSGVVQVQKVTWSRSMSWSFQKCQKIYPNFPSEDHPGTPEQTTTEHQGDSMIFTLSSTKVVQKGDCLVPDLRSYSCLLCFYFWETENRGTITKFILPNEKGVVKSCSGLKCHGNDWGEHGVGKEDGKRIYIFFLTCPWRHKQVWFWSR